jgi:sulfite reductase (NADPH) flavoprotein alpha-component
MIDLGAKLFYKRGEADDATGLEEVVEPWIEGLYAQLEKEIKLQEKESSTMTKLTIETTSETKEESESEKYDENKLYKARIKEGEYLTKKESKKQTIMVKLEIDKSKIKYQPGMSIGIFPTIKESDLDQIIKRMKVDGESYITIKNMDKILEKNIKKHFNNNIKIKEIISKLDVYVKLSNTVLLVFSKYIFDQSEKINFLDNLNSKFNFLTILNNYNSFIPTLEIILLNLTFLSQRFNF